MSKSPQIGIVTNGKDYVMIIVGLMLYAFGFCAFILPHEIVIGGLAGFGTLIYFATGGLIPVAVTSYACNLMLLALAYKIVGKTFVTRTVFGATVIAAGIGFFENIFMGIGHPLVPDRVVSIALGAIMCGVGVGTAFIHNGSSGGTDIVAAMVAKKSNVSIGRTMIFVDMFVVTLSIFLPFQGTWDEWIEARIPMIVYGFMVTFIVSYCADMIINTNRQATQFFIFSPKWREIADKVNLEAHRGVTVMDAMGWYSKKDIKVLMVWCRKIESVTIFRIIKSIDENAFVTQGAVNGVYGQGFDSVKIKMKKLKDREKHNEDSFKKESVEEDLTPTQCVRRSNQEE